MEPKYSEAFLKQTIGKLILNPKKPCKLSPDEKAVIVAYMQQVEMKLREAKS